MKKLTQEEFDTLIEGAKVLERQHDGLFLSALRTPDRHIIKIWQRRASLSSDRIKPYSQRFRVNCKALRRRGIVAPVITASYEVMGSGEHVVCYREIPGTPLAELAEQGRLPLRELAAFYAELHDKGIHFRSIHLGNVLQLQPDGLGLIDVTDTTFSNKPLSLRKRAENLGYAWAYPMDYRYFDNEVRARLLDYYITAAGMPQGEAGRFRKLLDRACEHYTTRRRKRAN